MERIVSRSELSPASSMSNSSPEPTTNAMESSGLTTDLEFAENRDTDMANDADQADADPADVEGMSFRLFAQAQKAKEIVKIKLQSPVPTDLEPGLVNPSRDRGYYFTNPLLNAELDRFRAAAVTGHDVLTRSGSHWPGCAYPWKVIHLASSRTPVKNVPSSFPSLLEDSRPPRRKRLGKKSRIKVRTRLASRTQKTIEDQQAAQLKAEAEREKRTRRNREKKVKKKMREKAKKLEHEGDAVNSSLAEAKR